MGISTSRVGLRRVALCALACAATIVPARAPGGEEFERGKALFAHEWLPGDSFSRAGDGLGPLFNESSCVACHFQGGPGGSGPASKNAEILSLSGLNFNDPTKPLPPGDSHPGLNKSKSVAFHRFGVDPAYGRWRVGLQRKDLVNKKSDSPLMEALQVKIVMLDRDRSAGSKTFRHLPNGMVVTQRNTPALFGSGMIDSISNEAIQSAASGPHPGFPQVKGRAAILKNGEVGRFGWKAEVPHLHEFVLKACANELGLDVPDHHQAASPLDFDAAAKGLDLSTEDCNALESYVRNLPAPASSAIDARRGVAATLKDGKALFEKSGCAACHRPSLGDVAGIYSDLLLHDMGDDLSDGGTFYGGDQGSPETIARANEWRTPPLWGFADSGPYLHDGRANTLEEAVALHGGEAVDSTVLYFELTPAERLKLQAFVRSLPAPNPAGKTAKHGG